MKPRRRKAFTLIELLVVIAIIAILAAILFPVFAQAKRAAKGTVALSGAKQLALGQLMYTNDSDDNFSPVVEFAPNPQVDYWHFYPFDYLEQPYMKSWGLLLDPTGPIPTDQKSLDELAGQTMALYGLWGMPPMKAATTGAFSSYVFGTSTTGKQMTGGQQWVYDGIGGIACNGTVAWASYGYLPTSVASLTTTSVANPADQVMIAQAGDYDFMWQQDNADSFDLYYSSCGDNTYGCKLVTTAPVARMRDNDGPAAGTYPWPGGTPTQEPTGMTAWAGTDGHVKSTAWRQLMGTTIPINNGTQQAIKAFWPKGS